MTDATSTLPGSTHPGPTHPGSTGSASATSAAPAGLQVSVLGIGLLGPGLADWASGAPLLAEPSGWQPSPTLVAAPLRLPPAERRRAGAVVKIALLAADQACAAASMDPAQLATVFSSSTADPANCHVLCEALAAPERLVSPTRFTNSVHNAASGYWHIATQCRQPATSLSALDGSFAAGLLEAAAQCASSGAPVLLVAMDVPYPEPLHRLRPVADSLAIGLVLGPAQLGQPSLVPGPADAASSAPQLTLSLAGAASPSPCADARLEALRLGIATGRALPLLEALARQRPAAVMIEGLPGMALQLDLHFPQLPLAVSPI